MAVTIRDVAKAAGVSPMAVSKVLHGRGGNVRVSQERAEEIKRIAAELNYIPNQIARSLRGERRYNIGLIMDTMGTLTSGSQYLANLLEGIHTACFEHGYSLTICPRLFFQHRRFIADGRFDGVIWAKYAFDPETEEMARQSGVRVVYLHVPYDPSLDDGFDYFCCENEPAVRTAVGHLVGLGHRVIDFGVDAVNEGCAEDIIRWRALQQTCAEFGIEAGHRYLLDGRLPGARAYLEDPDRGTAILLRSENEAGVLYEAAADLGLEIPDDISIVGFDSTDYCERLEPKLTAVRQPILQMAQEATEVLIRRIENKPVDTHIHSYPCGFDVRGSTGAPKY